MKIRFITYPALTLFALACFAFSPTVQAQLSPPPDGGYPGNNTAEGDNALFSLTTGVHNTATGYSALYTNTTGNDNTAIGFDTLNLNTNGFNNTAVGSNALRNNTEGSSNTAIGEETLFNETTAHGNIAIGHLALYEDTVGNDNVAIGEGALFDNTGGISNVAVGANVLNYNMLGAFNTASGYNAMFLSDSGNFNTAYGPYALENNVVGNNNIAIGYLAGENVNGDNNIDIGNSANVHDNGVIRIGDSATQTKAFIAGIAGTPIAPGVVVGVNANGQLGVKASSARFKEAIKPMDKASEAIFSLKPVTFRYRKALDPAAMPQFGLVAEQVAKVDPDLVVSDEKGQPFTVRYDEVNAMLLNEFLKEHCKVQEMETTIAKQEKQIEALTTGLQKVSDRLELTERRPQLVDNNR